MRKFLQLDWIILTAVFLLIVIGLMALFSISTVDNKLDLIYFNKQVIALLIGIVAMFLFSFYDYRTFNSYSTKLYFLSILILIGLFFLGVTVRGTTGWIGFSKFNVQPVEIVKIIIIIFLASFLSKKKNELQNYIKIIASIILISIPVFLIIKQPDFGSSLVIVGIWLIMLLVSGISKKSIIVLFLFLSVLSSGGYFILKDYQKDRIATFINPQNDPLGSGYNVIQSVVAVGSGGVFGKGLGHGSQSQLNFLPEKHTDFIFAVLAEELGLVGSGIVLILFLVIFYRLEETAKLARDNFGYLIVVGVMAMIIVQVFINIGMNIGIAPVTGVPLPFVSYGGSSLVSVLASLGLIQSVYIRRIKTLDQ